MNEFIAYLNSTNNIGGDATGSLAEKQVRSPFYDRVKVDRNVGKRIVDEIRAEKYKTYILTGHAGDGKTSILVQVLKELGLLRAGEGLEITKEYDHIFYVKDMSEIPEQNQTAILKKVLNAPKNSQSGILISNTGPLLRNLLAIAESDSQKNPKVYDEIELSSEILSQLDTNDDKEIEIAGYSFVLVNIARLDNVSFATRILKRMLDEELWKKCENCTAKEHCPMLNNQRLLSHQFERVSEFLDNFYRYLYENDKRMTIRQMIGQISYGITGNLTCDKVEKKFLKKPFFTYNFANLFFGHRGLTLDKNSMQIKGIEHINNLNLDRIALNVDYKLFVNHDYSFFDKDLKNILSELSVESRKHFQVLEEPQSIGTQQEKTARIRRAIRRFYLMFGHEQEGYPISDMYNHLYGSYFVDYKKVITSVQPTSQFRKLQNIVFSALYIKNTGYLPAGNMEMPLPLTLRREDDVFQSVLLVLGEVNKSDIKIISEKVVNTLEDSEEKNNLYIQIKDKRFKLSYPMMNYFSNLIAGSVTSNNNPALSHGIASLDTILLEQYGDVNGNRSSDCEISVFVNTTNGQKIKRFEFSEKMIQVIE